MGAFQGDVNGNLTVNLQTALPAGSNAIGSVVVSSIPTLPAGSNTIGSINVASAATGGASHYTADGGTNALLTNSVVSIKSSAAGTFKGFDCYNGSSAITYLLFFDVATSPGVTLGTTKPNFTYPVPAGGWFDPNLPPEGLAFTNGLQVAAVTSVTGSTAPGTGLLANIYFK
jgi:hypothetical protein